VHYYDRALGEGLREFAAVVDGNYHHLRRVLGDTAQSSEVGRTGLFEDTVPVKRDDHDCHYYYFQFRTGASGRPIRLPEVGVYWTTGVAGCQLVYSNENPSPHPTLEFIKPEDDVHEHHRPGYKEPKTFWQAYVCLLCTTPLTFNRFLLGIGTAHDRHCRRWNRVASAPTNQRPARVGRGEARPGRQPTGPHALALMHLNNGQATERGRPCSLSSCRFSSSSPIMR